MALLKLCRCGKKIDYNIRYCDECSIEVEEYKRDRVQQYDRDIRNGDSNKRYTSFYNSRAWRTLSDIVKRQYSGLCAICEVEREDNGDITHSYTTHHIVELKEDWSLRLVDENLVPLCHECHNNLHADYKEEDKILLKDIINKFKNKYKI